MSGMRCVAAAQSIDTSGLFMCLSRQESLNWSFLLLVANLAKNANQRHCGNYLQGAVSMQYAIPVSALVVHAVSGVVFGALFVSLLLVDGHSTVRR
jgi:hypothetical protein